MKTIAGIVVGDGVNAVNVSASSPKAVPSGAAGAASTFARVPVSCRFGFNSMRIGAHASAALVATAIGSRIGRIFCVRVKRVSSC